MRNIPGVYRQSGSGFIVGEHAARVVVFAGVHWESKRRAALRRVGVFALFLSDRIGYHGLLPAALS